MVGNGGVQSGWVGMDTCKRKVALWMRTVDDDDVYVYASNGNHTFKFSFLLVQDVYHHFSSFALEHCQVLRKARSI
jgi:hypothetical protein